MLPACLMREGTLACDNKRKQPSDFIEIAVNLLKICCVFSEHLFLRTPLDSCFFNKVNITEMDRIMVSLI